MRDEEMKEEEKKGWRNRKVISNKHFLVCILCSAGNPSGASAPLDPISSRGRAGTVGVPSFQQRRGVAQLLDILVAVFYCWYG